MNWLLFRLVIPKILSETFFNGLINFAEKKLFFSSSFLVFTSNLSPVDRFILLDCLSFNIIFGIKNLKFHNGGSK